jgi:hypothetical protein
MDLLRGRIARCGEHDLIKDPMCRFILLDRPISEHGSHLLGLAKDALLLLFTYHQVSAFYLNFITCLDSETGATDLRFGGFRELKCLERPGPCLREFGRSGTHYQVAFRLHSIQLLESKKSPQHQWRKQTAAIYHQFDIRQGKALWILSSPLEKPLEDSGADPTGKAINILWANLRNRINGDGRGNRMIEDDTHCRLSATLDTIATIADWSVGDTCFYVHDLENEVQSVVSTSSRV